MKLTDTLPQSKVKIGSAYQRRQRNIPDADMARVQRALLSDHQAQRNEIRAMLWELVAVVAAVVTLFLMLHL